MQTVRWCVYLLCRDMQGRYDQFFYFHPSALLYPLGIVLLLEYEQSLIFTVHDSFFIHDRCVFRTSQQLDIAVKRRGKVRQIHEERKKEIDWRAGHM